MISPRLVAQKPQIDDNFPGNKTLTLGSELTMECPIILNDSFPCFSAPVFVCFLDFEIFGKRFQGIDKWYIANNDKFTHV